MRQSTNATPPGCASQRKIDCPGPLDNLHCDTHSKNVVLYSRLSVLVERSIIRQLKMHPFSNIAFRGNLHRAAHLKNVVVYAQSAHLINTTSGGNGQPSNGGPYHEMMSRFIKRLILDGKKGAATKIFDASLELLKKNIDQYLEDNAQEPR